MLVEELKHSLKDKAKSFQEGKFFLIQQNLNQHSDFITISWMLHEMISNPDHKVTFIAFRENYAHFLSISKKMGTSIQQFLKNKQLQYIQCFDSEYCSQLPLTQSSPNSYIAPPTLIKKLKIHQLQQLIKNEFDLERKSTLIIDSISFLDQENNKILFQIYEKAVENECKIIFGGAMEGSSLINLFKAEADLCIKLQNDVANSGKLKIFNGNFQISLLWRFLQGKFQLTQHAKF